MKALKTLIVTGALAAFIIPAANATFDRTMPAKAPKVKVAKTAAMSHLVVAKRQTATQRVLCICVTGLPVPPQITEQQYEMQVDEDLIAHGEDPIYNTAATNSDNGSTTSTDDGSTASNDDGSSS